MNWLVRMLRQLAGILATLGLILVATLTVMCLPVQAEEKTRMRRPRMGKASPPPAARAAPRTGAPLARRTSNSIFRYNLRFF